MRIMFYVQHLLGIGHLVRASRIASAMVDAGQHVTMVTGGMPVEGFPGHTVDTIQLSPVRSRDSSFSELVDEYGRKVDEAGLASRRDALLKAFKAIEPECLVVEAFPFARRQMRFELLPLLEHVARLPAARRPLVASSIRDILQPKSPKRDQATAQLVRQYFDLVLVHADRRLATLDETFSAASSISDRLVYTGMVAPPNGKTSSGDRYDVIVSAGGGVVGENLLHFSIAARELTALNTARWLIVAGPNLPEEAVSRLQANASDGVEITRFRSDLSVLLRQVKVSVSQAGYNTVADVLSAKCAGVLVPFAADGEQEQTLRATRLEEAGLAVCLEQASLSASRLAEAVNAACNLDRANALDLQLDGAANTAKILGRRLEVFRRAQST